MMAGGEATVETTKKIPAAAEKRPSQSTAAASPRSRSGGAADFDVLIIGSGGAGVAAAIQAVGMGAKVAIVEAGTLGGTCVNVGCIPSKNLIEAAAHYRSAVTGFQGIAPCEPRLDWRSLIEQKNELVAELRQSKYADVLASYPGLVVLNGRATLDANGKVRVGAQEYSVRKIVVATGGAPARPPIAGIDEVGALDSTSIMELREIPSSLIVLGGSAVGLELGQTFARFGTKVTIVELLPQLLPNEDETSSEELRRCLEEEGMEIHTGARSTKVRRDGTEVVVKLAEGNPRGELRATHLLVATGRKPNTTGMGLEAAGVSLSPPGFIQVDSAMRTSNPNVYAAGDVTGGPGYVYVAAAGGRVAAENAVRSLTDGAPGEADPRVLDLSVVPNLTFTSPQVASVGLTEKKAREAGHNTQVAVLKMDQVPRAIVSRDTRGLVKMVSDAASGKLLGVHAVATNAGEFMGEAALAIRFGLTARDLAGTLHPYLTWVETMKLAAQGFTTDVSKLSCCA
ncbi:MAG TPA: mercury(II) reductase [Gemmatimonadaceae bacterium]|nr:mercury(II) reductase [Gemmatimonadaceae bacterium]